jgi:uncharacterized protein YqgV (UPF0045/DUF77 family)
VTQLRVEFTVFPFKPGGMLPAHAQAAVDALQDIGLAVEVGPLSAIVSGEAHLILNAIRAAQEAAISAGAERITLNVEVQR